VPPSGIYSMVAETMLDQTDQLQGVECAPILRDDFNVAEYLDVAVRIRMRENIRKFWGEALVE
jgi:hypothetical protein